MNIKSILAITTLALAPLPSYAEQNLSGGYGAPAAGFVMSYYTSGIYFQPAYTPRPIGAISIPGHGVYFDFTSHRANTVDFRVNTPNYNGSGGDFH